MVFFVLFGVFFVVFLPFFVLKDTSMKYSPQKNRFLERKQPQNLVSVIVFGHVYVRPSYRWKAFAIPSLTVEISNLPNTFVNVAEMSAGAKPAWNIAPYL